MWRAAISVPLILTTIAQPNQDDEDGDSQPRCVMRRGITTDFGAIRQSFANRSSLTIPDSSLV